MSTNDTPSRIIPTDGLLGFWPLDDRSGEVAHDISSHLRHGRCKGASFGEHDGRAAALFNGDRAFVEVPHAADLELDDEITIAARLWKESANDAARWDAILSKTPGVWDYELLTSMAKSDEIAFFSKPCTPDEVYSATPVPARRWAHVAVTRIESNVTFYLDGVSTVTVSMEGTYPKGGGTLQIGHDDAAKNGGMRGWMCDVALYGRGLSANEVASLAR